MPIDIRRFLLASMIAALLAVSLFVPGLPGEFVFDDIPNIVNNPVVHVTELSATAVVDVLSAKQVSGNLRGLPMLSFALDYWRAGGVADPATFKTTNLLIHALTACALAWLFRALLLASGMATRRVAWLAPALALAWAAHPLQVSAVLYAVQRLQTMGTLFLVLALLAYLQARRAQIRGDSGRTGLLGCLLLWAVAMGCKEDSILLPAYALALELTVLRFAAADAPLANTLRRGYLWATLAGVAVYALWVVPHYWYWEAPSGRDFSTWERLLTQPRVLALYLWQILLPLPQHMPFYYDWIAPSRDLLQPWTTLPALVLVAALLALGWRLRRRQPLFALGVFLFFAAHFVTSNVIPLELAYEHRNHFALIGAVLAVASVLLCLGQRLRPAALAVVGAVLLVALGSATLLRAHTWSSNLTLARAATEAVPNSPRAWAQLCKSYFDAGGAVAAGQDNPYLDEAIDACSAGAAASSETLNSLVLLIVLKTIRGDITAKDWERFQQRLTTARMSPENVNASFGFAYYARLGVKLEKAQLIETFAMLDRRTTLNPYTLIYIGNFIAADLMDPDQAMPHYLKAIRTAPPGEPFAWKMATELREFGRPDLAEALEKAGMDRLREADDATKAR